MNIDEEIAYEYLKSKGFKSITPEPDGNVTPDFSIHGKIAIEVRRLNENYFTDGKAIGHYEEYIKLWEFMTHFLSKYKNENLQKGYWISFGYERPIPEFAELKKALKTNLDKIIKNPISNEANKIMPSFTIRLYPKQTSESNSLQLAASHDDNGGGAVLQIYFSNIKHCIEEKANKIEKYRNKYSEWWLILVDRIIYRTAESKDMERIKNSIKLPRIWKKLVILNPETKKSILTLSN